VDAAGAAPEASFVAATTSRSSTATLASLYLRQGHPREAKEIFERVLERQPDDEAAQLGLAQTTAPAIPVPAGHSSRQVSSLRRLDARDLLAGIDPAAVGPGSSDLTSKRLLVLRQYLSRLRGTDRRQHAS
jgi:hypothetical protein